ncbi:MAG TPA: hypothetical protein VI875_00630 [Candidatus Norongarragalinales archaeon]|nr:hypothetical protein [Candidatus Norongarragalinales archaeon]
MNSLKFFGIAIVVFSLVLAGCLTNTTAKPTPSPSETPQPTLEIQSQAPSELAGFVETAEEFDSLKAQDGLTPQDLLLLDANQEYILYLDSVSETSESELDCGNADAHQNSLDQLQASIDKGIEALALMQDESQAQYWSAYFDSMQGQKDAFESDLYELCTAENTSA